ncbi:MAG: cysteine protease StiP family protein [Pseudomonadota bacterium]|nr:cysteine protease StiP family protein [Pseudomonadota bacterium]
MTGFSGSYQHGDVTFLLKRVEMAPVERHEKERLLQSGARHYSEMIGAEEPPDSAYLDLFHEALATNTDRLAMDLARLALALAQRSRPPVLVSLARAGTPIGVLLRRALSRLGIDAPHYSISIIRGRGVDERALDWILAHHSAEAVVFVDGWTGKGAIADELAGSVGAYAASRRVVLDPGLVVVSDLAGVAAMSASEEDYLIPSAILNAVVSGLVSRTILHADHLGPGDFHACVEYNHLTTFDLSRWFVDTLDAALAPALTRALATPAEALVSTDRTRAREVSRAFVTACLTRYGVGDPNRVKPGIGEATRALLRRVPERLLLRDPHAEAVRHLRLLAERREVPIEVDPALPYNAAVLIRTLGRDA